MIKQKSTQADDTVQSFIIFMCDLDTSLQVERISINFFVYNQCQKETEQEARKILYKNDNLTSIYFRKWPKLKSYLV